MRPLSVYNEINLEVADKSFIYNGTLIETTALVDQVTSRGRLSGIDVADNDEIDLILLLGHGYG